MLVAFLADIHGNGPALAAVLDDLPSVDAVVCGGDLVGYYPDAPEVVERVRSLNALTIRGNHELMVCGRRPEPAERARRYRAAWTRGVLSEDQLRWLDALPVGLDLAWDDLHIRVRHASPWDEETYVYPDAAALTRIMLEPRHWLVLGHTHYPMQRTAGAGCVVNPGSVGQPRDWNPDAAYALLNAGTGEWHPRRVSYDYVSYQQRLERMGWDPWSIHVLARVRAATIPT